MAMHFAHKMKTSYVICVLFCVFIYFYSIYSSVVVFLFIFRVFYIVYMIYYEHLSLYAGCGWRCLFLVRWHPCKDIFSNANNDCICDMLHVVTKNNEKTLKINDRLLNKSLLFPSSLLNSKFGFFYVLQIAQQNKSK